MGICDKCGQKVHPSNDVVKVEIQMGSVLPVGAHSRHLLPVIVEGTVRCVGCPSHAQYVDGQPRDKSGAYPYNTGYEKMFRPAYEEVCKKYPTK